MILIVGTFVIYFHTKFQMTSSSVSLLITVKPRDKFSFRAAEVLFYILQKLNKVAYFRHSVSLHHFRTLYLVGLVSLPTDEFVQQLRICITDCRKSLRCRTMA
jgi:hypothetical protein